MLKVLDTDCACVTKFEKFLASRESIFLLTPYCFRPLLRKEEDKIKENTEGKEKINNSVAVREGTSDSTALVPSSTSTTATDSKENIPIKSEKEHSLSLKLPGTFSAEEEAVEQRHAILSYNTFRILKRLSQCAPLILFNNIPFLNALQHMIPICLQNTEINCYNKISQSTTLPYSGYSLHQKAVVAMEITYRNAHQLKLLCEIIIEYCRSNPADANNSSTPHNNTHSTTHTNTSNTHSSHNTHNEMFEQMIFSLLPVLTMKTCIVDFTFLFDFLKFEVPVLCASASAKKQLLKKTFYLVAGKRASVALKVKVIQVNNKN